VGRRADAMETREKKGVEDQRDRRISREEKCRLRINDGLEHRRAVCDPRDSSASAARELKWHRVVEVLSS
jgi:hypothetical protein